MSCESCQLAEQAADYANKAAELAMMILESCKKEHDKKKSTPHKQQLAKLQEVKEFVQDSRHHKKK